MKNVVIIGQSPAAYAAVKAVLDRDPSVGLTLISCDGQLPYDRSLLPGLIDRSVMEKDIFCAGEEYFAAAKVQVIRGRDISRINFERKRIFMSEKLTVDYDGLILADAPDVRFPQLKGVRRQGVFHLARLEMVKNLVRFLTFTETALLEPLGFAGIKAALALKAMGKDVIVLSRHENLLQDVLSPERSVVLTKALVRRGIRVIPGGIEDIIGETEVKAVRLRTGKVVACDMVVLEEAAPDMRFLEGTAVIKDDAIPVAGPFRTLVHDVHAIDVMAKMDSPLFDGAYRHDANIGSMQAALAVAGLWGEDVVPTATDHGERDVLDSFFHPEELSAEPVAEIPPS